MTKAQRNSLDVRVGRRVRMTRIFRDCGILEAAHHLNVSVLEYAELEEGKRRFDAAQLAKLCKLLQVSVVIFFGELAKIDLRTYYKPNLLVYYASNDNAARRSRP